MSDNKDSGRQSPRFKDLQSGSATTSNITDAQLKQHNLDIKSQNEQMISKLNEYLARIDKNTGEIQALKVENSVLKNKVNVLDGLYLAIYSASLNIMAWV